MKRTSISITAIPTDSQQVKILIEGELVIKNSKQIKDKLIAGLAQFQQVELELKNIQRIDLSALQLFLAMRKSGIKQGKQVNFNVEITEYITSTLKAYGMVDLFNVVN